MRHRKGKGLIIVLAAVLGMAVLSGCGNAAAPSQTTDDQASAAVQESASEQGSAVEQEVTEASQEYVGIISAMANEVDLLLSEAEIDHVDTFGGVDFHVGTLHGQPVVIAQAGIGKVLASAGLTAMLNNYPISDVIFTGIAGGVGDETEVLDEVIATRLVQHDYGNMTNDGFEWTDSVVGEEVGEDGYFYSNEALVDAAYDAAVSVMGEEHVFTGTIASGDQFVASEEYVETLQEEFDAIACEMEGASIAAVCTQYDTPFVVIRTMSDKADGNAHETIDNMGDLAADQSSQIVIEMLENGI
ncbi:MAG: 5'-methylthioadenosine/adenosylhomocysteine nucleosidase [Eubacterium sp.]|nr:5'-methylthioadenosine/adenosylhomocysteine nucleosidase [Eubacterium sp.]